MGGGAEGRRVRDTKRHCTQTGLPTQEPWSFWPAQLWHKIAATGTRKSCRTNPGSNDPIATDLRPAWLRPMRNPFRPFIVINRRKFMMRFAWKAACVLAAASLIGVAASASADPLTVTTQDGSVHGKTINDGKVRAWLGIPYAAPPVGDLRWKAPQ